MELELLSGNRQSRESDNSVIACNDWLRLGPGRTLTRLLEKYSEIQRNTAPTRSLNTLQQWSSRYDWAERANAFDATWEHRKNAERRAEMDYGLALDYERVRKLKRLADFLEMQIYETIEEEIATNIDDKTVPGVTLYDTEKQTRYPNVWVRDAKSIHEGNTFTRVEIERFNPAIFSEYRAVLDDLAKEVGGRIRKSEVSTKDWQDRAVEDIRSGVIPPDAFDELAATFDYDLATQLFARAGVPVPLRQDTKRPG